MDVYVSVDVCACAGACPFLVFYLFLFMRMSPAALLERLLREMSCYIVVVFPALLPVVGGICVEWW